MSAVSSTLKRTSPCTSKSAPFRSRGRFCHANQGSLVIGFRSGTQFDPCVSSVTSSIMITTSNSPVMGSGMPNQLLGVRHHTIAMYGLSRVRTELFQLLVIPSLAPHPVHPNRQSPRHGDFGDLPPSPHRQVKISVTPFLIAAHCNLRRFHQQEAQQ